jgi:hypothetical protein
VADSDGVEAGRHFSFMISRRFNELSHESALVSEIFNASNKKVIPAGRFSRRIGNGFRVEVESGATSD